MPTLTDTSLMPFGPFAGTQMQNVPAIHLVWIHYLKSNFTVQTDSDIDDVFDYANTNISTLTTDAEIEVEEALE